MKDNLFHVAIINGGGNVKEHTFMRINDPVIPGSVVTAMRNKGSLPKIRIFVIQIENNVVFARIAK